MTSYSFAQLPRAEIPRSKFNLSFDRKMPFNSGYLVPFFVEDVIPGDTFDLNTAMVARLTTPIVPVMDNIHLDTFFFFVPNRLLWDNWEKFFAMKQNGDGSGEFLEPQVDLTAGCEFASLFDYIGVPPGIKIPMADCPSALPFRACNKIYNDWFRADALIEELETPMDDGPDDPALYSLQKRGKRHDYFTSSLISPQYGQSVTIPLGLNAPVVGNGLTLGLTDGTSLYGSSITPEYRAIRPVTNGYGLEVGTDSMTGSQAPSNTLLGVTDDPAKSGLVADLSQAVAPTINTLRYAFALQRFAEALNRSGQRYTEILQGIFNVTSPDQRLQRAELLGGTTDFINVHQIAQTSATDGTSPQGNLAAYGYMSSVKNGFTKSFVEHGWVIGFVNVWTDLTYQQGLRRQFSKRTVYDYMIPQFANIGEQAVKNKEIFLSEDEEQNNAPFGYQERYAEYRYHPSEICGVMRSTAPQSLDVWHLSQKFDNLPTLSKEFIEENPPLSRILAVQDEPEIRLDIWFDFKAVRPLPLFGIPGFGDRL